MSIKQAIEALEEACESTSYYDAEDTIGMRSCCRVLSYEAHADDCKQFAALAALRSMPQGEPWHNPVATAVRDGTTGQVQLEYIGHFPADELVRLYAAPQPHHIDLLNVAVAVRDACHRAWVTSAENWRADVDVRQIVRDTATPHTEAVRMSEAEILDKATLLSPGCKADLILFARAVEQATAARLGVKLGDARHADQA